jgi:predicted small metal-binding protein
MAECGVLQEASESVKSEVNSVPSKETCFYCAELELEWKQTQLELKTYKNTVNLLYNQIIHSNMAEGSTCFKQTAYNREISRDNGCSNCVNCELLKKELPEITLEMKSAHHIIALLQDDINMLKKEVVSGNTYMKEDLVNKLKQVEVPFSLDDNTTNSKAITRLNKRSSNSNIIMPPTIETSNRFSILHNLNQSASQDSSDRLDLPTQPSINNSSVSKNNLMERMHRLVFQL